MRIETMANAPVNAPKILDQLMKMIATDLRLIRQARVDKATGKPKQLTPSQRSACCKYVDAITSIKEVKEEDDHKHREQLKNKLREKNSEELIKNYKGEE